MLISDTRLTACPDYIRHRTQTRLQHNVRLKNNEHVRRLAVIEIGYLMSLNHRLIDDCATFNFW